MDMSTREVHNSSSNNNNTMTGQQNLLVLHTANCLSCIHLANNLHLIRYLCAAICLQLMLDVCAGLETLYPVLL